jgi:hypothetical protein
MPVAMAAIVIAFSAAALGGTASVGPTGCTPSEVKALVTRFLSAFNAGSPNRL